MSDHAIAAYPSPSASAPAAPGISRALQDAEHSGHHGGVREVFLYLMLAALLVATWLFTRLQLYTTQSDTAYWLGVAGGVSMLLLLSYPMRKYLRFMQRLGKARLWFLAHILLGLTGPLLILLHSNFEINSLNAGVAFYSMFIVAVSGIAGRFLYVRLHRNVNGVSLGLDQLRERLVASNTGAVRLRFAPHVVERCREFERQALEQRIVTGAEIGRAMVLLPWLRWRASAWCNAELRRRLVAVAHTEGWTRRQLQGRHRAAQRLVDSYLGSAQNVAMFSAWARLFSWWHVAHTPFVYLLFLSAIVHVIAVHAY
ncbi:conserved membrane hypothetical protein [Rubrivivax sp. A210]|uniref:hypothetical protein n=1 Tax=Rubrivivax sp. A210 TaxID=2772301 RepID=UPI00191B6875|nr:hypothetical protein [Rubrivivax sp. A210]CAD5366364.1 conserved membrane hypothetical protein [Rubrivivax sp. A210]